MGETYPIQLKLEGLLCVVAGGGRVAARKVQSLLGSGASVVVVSPSVIDAIQTLIQENKVVWHQKAFSPEDLQGATLVFSCTDQREINEKVADSLQPGQWINVVDRPELSTFYVPAHFRRGLVTVSVATEGASPGLARKIKEKLKEEIDEAYEPYGYFLASCRKVILEQIPEESVRRELFYHLLDEVYVEDFRRGEGQNAERRFLKLVEESLRNGNK